MNRGEATIPMALSPAQETQRDRLNRLKKEYEDRLADINDALKLLDENPLLEKFHNAIQRCY